MRKYWGVDKGLKWGKNWLSQKNVHLCHGFTCRAFWLDFGQVAEGPNGRNIPKIHVWEIFLTHLNIFEVLNFNP